MVNIILCGSEGAVKKKLLERIKALKNVCRHYVISEVQQDGMRQNNIRSVEDLLDSELVNFHEWVIKKQCQLEERHPTFLTDNCAFDSVVQVHCYVSETEAEKLIDAPELKSSIERFQSSLVILVLTQPCSYKKETHKECENIANLYRSYFHRFHIAYLELRDPKVNNNVETVKAAITYGKIPLETTRLQNEKKENIMPQTNFAFYRSKPENSDGVHIPTITITEHFSEQRWTSYPQGETNRFIQRHGDENLALMSFDIRVKTSIVQTMLENGLTINGSLYSFLGCSSSGLKERKCYLWKGSDKEAMDKLAENGDFKRISSLPKRMARIGLLFSGVKMTRQVPRQIITENDIERYGKCFTDGCGGIGTDLARNIYNELQGYLQDNQSYLPSVYQVRFRGYKGVLAVDPNLDTKSIKVRPSMKKFETSVHACIGVCGYSRAHTFGHLNKQFIMLLSGLNVPDREFLKKQKEHFDNVLEMGKNQEKTITILQWQNKFDVAQMIMRLGPSGFAECSDQIKKCIYSVQGKLMSKSEKLSILIPKSRTVYGICDPTGTLEYGECFLRVTLGNLQQPKTIRGKIVVCKNPCYLLGDVRVLNAVGVEDSPDVEGLNHLVDCIVFPVRGERPHSDEIAGSDLDGDEYFVTWDVDLIPPSIRPPYDYPASKKVSREENKIHYFAKQNETKKLTATVDRYFCKWANARGVASVECQNLGMLFSRVIDSSKTGEPLAIPCGLIPPDDVDEDEEGQSNYVWQKMLKEATIRQNEFKEGVIRDHEALPNAAFVSESFVEEILGQEFSNITEFEKFTFALNHTNDIETVLDLYGDTINFSLFSREEKCEALLSGVPKDLLENALNWSNLLSLEDLTYFKMQTFRHPWSFYFQAQHDKFEWKLLVRALTEHDKTFIVFEVPDSITVVLQFQTKLNLGLEQTVPAGTICGFLYSRRFGYRLKYVLGSDYTLDLSANTLQLYRNKDKTLSFLWLNASDYPQKKQVTLGNETTNAISVNLVRFDKNILRDVTKPHPTVRKMPFLEIEVFAHNNSGIVPYFDSYEANDVLPVPQREDPETETEDDGCVDFETMMLCEATYCVQSEEELLEKLQTTASNSRPLAFKMILETWRETNKNLPSKVELCIIHLLKQVLLSVPPLSFPDHVKDVLKCLAQSIVYEAPNVKFEILGLLSSLGLEETARNLCEKYEKEIQIPRPAFLELMNKWQIWWMLDKNTAQMFLSKLQVYEELTQSWTEQPEEDTYDPQICYINHFGKLQLMDLLQEAECVKQKMNQCKTDTSISNLKVLKRKDEKEETLTFCRSSLLEHNPKITKGQHVAITRQSDFKRSQSFRSCCCVAQVVTIRYAPVNVTVKIIGELPTVLSQNIDPSSEKCSLWRITLMANVTTHTRVVNALSSLVSSESESKESSCLSPELLHMLVQPGGHPKQCPLSRSNPFTLHNNVSGLRVESNLDTEQLLNPQQKQAVISAVEHRVCLIQGPPGTGKTTVACHIIKTIHSKVKDSKVLVVAETNIAVDNIVKKLKVDMASEILRVGSEGGIDPEVFDVSLEGQLKMVEEREAKRTTYRDEQGMVRVKTRLVQSLLRKAAVVLTTCAGAGDPVLKSSTFEFVLVDEATQTKETTLLCSLGHGAKNLIMIGDPQQLGPVAVKEESSTYDNLPDLVSLSTTLFHRLHGVMSNDCVFLDTQHRMHSALMKFPSVEFYGGRLLSAIEDSTRKNIIFPWPDRRRPLCFINVDAVERRLGTSFSNDAEVEVVQNVLQMILNIPEEQSEFRLDTTEIGILSLYQGQVVKIKNAITFPVEVRSVDGFQGREKEVIIVSTVRANTHGTLGFVDDKNRINVLLTRAKRGLIVVGNEETLKTSEIWSKWLEEAPRLEIAAVEYRADSTPSKRQPNYRGQGYQRGRGRGNNNRRGLRGHAGRGNTNINYTDYESQGPNVYERERRQDMSESTQRRHSGRHRANWNKTGYELSGSSSQNMEQNPASDESRRESPRMSGSERGRNSHIEIVYSRK